LELSFLESDAFVIGYYVLTVGASLALIKETKNRWHDLKKGIKSVKYAPLSFGVITFYALFLFDFLDTIPM